MNLINVLTKSHFLRYMIAFGLIALVAFRLLADENHVKPLIGFSFLILGFTFAFYLNMSWRLITLIHSAHAHLTPQFFAKTKQAVVVTIALSLLPSLAFMPNFDLFSNVLAGQLLIILVIGLCYIFTPLFWLFVGVFILNGAFSYIVTEFNLTESFNQVIALVALALPLTIPFSLLALGIMIWRLDNFKLSADKLAQIKSGFSGNKFKPVSLNNSRANNQADAQEKTKKRFTFINFSMPTDKPYIGLRKLLATQKQLNKQQLLIIANGHPPFLTWLSMSIILGVFLVSYALASIDLFLVSLTDVTVFALVGFSGSLMLLSFINFLTHYRLNRLYLAKLRLTPLFKNDDDFSASLFKTYLKQQATCIVFSTVFVVIFFSLLGRMNVYFLAQLLSIYLVVFCYVTSLLLLGLSYNLMHKKIMMLLPIVFFIAINIYTLMYYFDVIDLSVSIMFAIVVSAILLLTLSWFNWKKHGINWQLA
ncbi:hypothetical protein [Algibacillus agarilyticus]|uniref:hypothetical protein n=1 Tax=Algibacillus agarilyticus TaxID=2234133 RepID=UPI000DD00281|nr:hypothetical protein [Algibacillus agarilyticus]